MPEPHQPLAGLVRRGLADEPLPTLRTRVLGAWDDFLALVEQADLAAPSRLPGLSGGDVLVHLGLWDDGRVVDALVEDARRGGSTEPLTPDGVEGEVLDAHRDEDAAALRDAIRRSRERVQRFFDDGEAEEVGRSPTASALGPLPVLSLVGAGTYELAVHALDLEPCGAPGPSDRLLDAGLGALLDVTGALCARHGLREQVSAVTPAGTWRIDSRSGEGWTTTRLEASPDVRGAAVRGRARDLLDVSAGRAKLGPLLAARRVTVSGMPTFLRLAPLVEEVPGIPGGEALRQAARGLNGVGRIARGLGRFVP